MEKKINIAVWCVISAAVTVWGVVYPRVGGAVTIIYVLIILTKLIKSPVTGSGKSDQHSHTKITLTGVCLLAVVAFFGSWLNIFCPYHALYEYKGEIRKMKSSDSAYYSHFPDEIPDGAYKRKCISSPYLVYCDALFFYTDDSELLCSVYEEYESQAVHKLSGGCFGWNDKDGYPLTFSAKKYVPAGTENGVTTLILRSNENQNHHRCSGIYFNFDEGYICYFRM